MLSWVILAIVVYLTIGIAFIWWEHRKVRRGIYKGRTIRVRRSLYYRAALWAILTWPGYIPFIYFYNRAHPRDKEVSMKKKFAS